MSTDADHRFDLAIALNDLETALSLVRASPTAGAQAKWKIVGDKALAAWQMDLAQEAFEKADDLPALLLLFTSLSDRAGMERLAKLAQSKGQNNIAFAAFLQLGDTASCISLLASTNRLPEASLFARSYQPNAVPKLVKEWRGEMDKAGKGKIAATIADPEEDGDLFPEGFKGSGSGVTDGEGSGVMVEKEDEEMNGEVNGEKGPVEAVVEKVKEPVEGLVEKVKDMTVGNGDGRSLFSIIPSFRYDHDCKLTCIADATAEDETPAEDESVKPANGSGGGKKKKGKK